MVELSYGEKIFISKLSVMSFQFILANTLWYTLYLFDLGNKYDTILYNLYYTFLVLFTLLTLLNIYISILYFINRHNFVDISSYRDWYINQSVLKYEFKIFLNIFLYLFGMIISIYAYASRIFFSLPIMYTIQLIILSTFIYLFLGGMLVLVLLAYCCNCISALSFITNTRRQEESSNMISNININRNQTNQRNNETYPQPSINNYVNIQIRIPTPIQNISLEPINSSNDMNCSICLDDESCSRNWVRLPCDHKYHRLCIERWLINSLTCPMCRQEVISLV